MNGMDIYAAIADLDRNPPMWSFEVPGPYGVKGSTFSFLDRRGKLRTKTDCKHGKKFAHSVRVAALAAGVKLIPKGTGVTVSAGLRIPSSEREGPQPSRAVRETRRRQTRSRLIGCVELCRLS